MKYLEIKHDEMCFRAKVRSSLLSDDAYKLSDERWSEYCSFADGPKIYLIENPNDVDVKIERPHFIHRLLKDYSINYIN